jgi:small subunit ribosomal protein S15
MSLNNKAQIIKDSQNHSSDTGSSEVQISILSSRIEELTKHLQKNKKDLHSRRGLLQMVMDRKSHLNYLLTVSPKRFKAIKTKLGL